MSLKQSLMAALGAFCLIGGASHAEGEKGIPLSSLSFIHNTPKPFGWRITYGPVGKVDVTKVVRLETHQRNGYAIFSCDATGNEELAMAFAGYRGKQGETVPVRISSAGQSHIMPMLVASEKGTGGVESILYAHGDDVVGLLNALVTLPEDADVGMTAKVGSGILERTIKAPSVAPHSMGELTDGMCVGWHNKVSEQNRRKSLQSQMLH